MQIKNTSKEIMSNCIQIVSFNALTLTLLGAMLLKVDVSGQESDGSIDMWFAENFLVWISVAVPVSVVFFGVAELAVELQLTDFGTEMDARLRELTEEESHFLTQKEQDLKYLHIKPTTALERLKHRRDKILHKRNQILGLIWKKPDVPRALLENEVAGVVDRNKDANRAKVELHHAEVELSEQRQWLRFALHECDNEEEFYELVETNDPEIFKKTILHPEEQKDEVEEAVKEVWKKLMPKKLDFDPDGHIHFRDEHEERIYEQDSVQFMTAHQQKVYYRKHKNDSDFLDEKIKKEQNREKIAQKRRDERLKRKEERDKAMIRATEKKMENIKSKKKKKNRRKVFVAAEVTINPLSNKDVDLFNNKFSAPTI
jgi:hypothetical protein